MLTTVVFVLLSLLAGFLLARRYKVLVLVPSIGCIAFLAVFFFTAAYAHGLPVSAVIWTSVWAAFVLQIGYLAGAGLRQLKKARAARHPPLVWDNRTR